MWFSTKWTNKRRFIITAITTSLYIGVIILLLLIEPSYNTSGVSLPFSSDSGYTEMSESSNKNRRNKEGDFFSSSKQNFEDYLEEEDLLTAPSLKRKTGDKNISRWVYSILFFLFMLFLIIWQNYKASKKKSGYENPFVDTNQYKLPLADDAKIPLVHYLNIKLQTEEKVLYATETIQKNNEGELAVTNKRIIIQTKEEKLEFPLKVLEAVSSATNSVLLLTSGSRKYYIFLHEEEMKYALAVIRWAHKKEVL